jgi:hypothetical protein
MATFQAVRPLSSLNDGLGICSRMDSLVNGSSPAAFTIPRLASHYIDFQCYSHFELHSYFCLQSAAIPNAHLM